MRVDGLCGRHIAPHGCNLRSRHCCPVDRVTLAPTAPTTADLRPRHRSFSVVIPFFVIPFFVIPFFVILFFFNVMYGPSWFGKDADAWPWSGIDAGPEPSDQPERSIQPWYETVQVA